MAVKSITFEEKDLGMNAIIKQIKKLEGSHTDVGLFGSGGGPADNLAARAVVHEYGSVAAGIPKRPYNRKAFDDNLRELKIVITELYNMLLERRITARILLEKTGEHHTTVIKDTVNKGGFEPNKPATIRAKGSSRPLVDTADMRNRTEHKETMK